MRLGWPRLLLLAAVLAVAAHLAAVWALPRVIMWRLGSAAPEGMERRGAIFLPAMTDHRSRRVVMPSPDLMYALCPYDLRDRPWRIHADPHAPHYWSVALYDANSDNFWVGSDRQAAGRPMQVLLLGPGQAAPAEATAAGAQVVHAPSARGLMLMRLLVTDRVRDLPAIEDARRSLHCEPA